MERCDGEEVVLKERLVLYLTGKLSLPDLIFKVKQRESGAWPQAKYADSCSMALLASLETSVEDESIVLWLAGLLARGIGK